MGSIATLRTAEAAAILVGALVAWALGLYVATRGGWRPIPLLTLAAVAVLVAYLSGAALAALAPDRVLWAEWLRRSWWAAALAPAAWLALVAALARDESADHRFLLPLGGVAGAALLAGAAFALLGSATDLVVAWAEDPSGLRHLPPAELFGVYQVYVLAALLVAAGVLGGLWRTSAQGSPLRDRFRGLLGSAVLFLLAGAYLTIVSGLFGYSGLLGALLLLGGLLLLGWNMARYGALLAGEVVGADLVLFGGSLLALALLYGGVLVLPRLSYAEIERALPVLLLLLATHALADARAHVLDRLVLGPVRGAARGRLRGLAERVGRQPDALAALADVREGVDALVREQSAEAASAPSVDGEFRLLVEGALRRLNDLPALSGHPLLDALPQADGELPLQRGTRLRAALEQAIERLRPPGGARPTPGSVAGPGGWLHYLVLREAYVDGRPNKQIMQRYGLSEGTFHRARRRAADAVAVDLRERFS